jgi:uncharacterized protein
LILDREIDRTENREAVAFQCDHRPEERGPQNEGFRSVDRVDYPAKCAAFLRLTEFLSEDRIFREAFFERIAQELLNLPVGTGNWAVIGFDFYIELRVVIIANDLACLLVEIVEDREKGFEIFHYLIVSESFCPKLNIIPFRILSVHINLILLCCLLTSCAAKAVLVSERELAAAQEVKPNATPLERVLAHSIVQTTKTLTYDAAYVELDYPNGDVPIDRGVCADVIVRSFRQGGIDLQKELHEDMAKNFAMYPQKWGAKRTDKNIDHRRVPNLMTWFERQGKNLPLSQIEKDYLPGDIVAWEIADGRFHIGIVSGIKIKDTYRYAVVHNIGSGARLEDVLFTWKVAGHYRYF